MFAIIINNVRFTVSTVELKAIQTKGLDYAYAL